MAVRNGILLPGSIVGRKGMGTFSLPFSISNADGTGSLTLEGMVDTGSLYSVVPGSILDELGIARDEEETFSLADCSLVEMDIGLALMTLEGRSRTVHVAFGTDDEIILIGAMTLERFGAAADPVNQRLVPARITL
jgi:predicted aspartyl protease